jgi:hypothetical protein
MLSHRPQKARNAWLLFQKPIVYKNTIKYKAKAFGFYALNDAPIIGFKEHSFDLIPHSHDMAQGLAQFLK